MTIEWRQQMSVDGGKIDEDHRHLIDIINRFEVETPHFTGTDDAMEILHALKFYCKTHFEREEQLQRLSAFPFATAHAQEHTDLVKQLDTIIDKTRNCGEGEIIEISTMMTELLKDWLIGHVVKSDLRMKPYIHEMAPHGAAMKSLGTLKPDE